MRHTLVGLCLMLIFVGDAIKSTNAETGASFGNCVTPRQAPGLCIYLTECKSINDILSTGKVSASDRAFLAASQCGYHNEQYLVCCPDMNIDDRFNPSAGEENGLPQPPNCPFEFNDRIKGGHDTNFDEYPWTAMIEYTKPGNEKGRHCGGSLINNRYVITAAHCTKGRIPSDWRLTGVRLGEWDTTTNPDCIVDTQGKQDCADPYVDVAVTKITPHPHYQPNSRHQQHDIALLRLARKVSFSHFIKPICLPSESRLQNEIFERIILDVAGWGVTDTGFNSERKQTANVTVWNMGECRNKYSTQKIALIGGQMCAGGQEGVDSCSGDSGGPLIYKYKTDKSYFFLAGIVSFGPTECGQAGWPGVYTRVGQYIDWIRQNIEP